MKLRHGSTGLTFNLALPAFVRAICKAGQGSACCRYLLGGPEGFHCGKLDAAMRAAIDERQSTMVAKGDNCAGRPAGEIL